MKRKHFLKLSGAALAGFAACTNEAVRQVVFSPKHGNYNITFQSDMAVGHLVFEGQNWPFSEELTTETLIVGGGVAGLSAAAKLKGEDFLLCELSEALGGTSSAVSINGTDYAQGAHYDLSYPQNFGPEVLDLLEKINLITFNKTSSEWTFTDRKHIISPEIEEQCWHDGKMSESVLKKGDWQKNFLDLMEPYSGKMPLPSRLIESEYHHLNQLTFKQYLEKYLPTDLEMHNRISYQMLDDYGGNIEQVSALAGIHYYKCRPYFSSPSSELFSPPEGNNYFVTRLAAETDADQLKTNHLVFHLEETKDGFVAEVLDVKSRTRKRITANKVIYAAQKHALKYIYPQGYPLFATHNYSPWLVMNIALNQSELPTRFWQNDMIVPDSNFLGFVNSQAQNNGNSSPPVLMAYYCYPAVYRHYLKDVEAGAQTFVYDTVKLISQYYNTDLTNSIDQVHVKLMGHAMAIPEPGFLLNDANEKRTNPNLVYAGVDNGRLPLFFEAVDSGVKAAELVLNQ